MIRYGNRLTLSEVDVRRWTRITGFEPTAIATVAALEVYVRECKRYYAEPSDDSAFLNWLMDVELERQREAGAERWVYEIKLLRTGGALVKLKVDARDGSVISHRVRDRAEGEPAGPRPPFSAGRH